MMFLFHLLKLGVWSSIYYFRPSKITFNIIINNIKRCGPITIKLVQWALPKIEAIYEIDKQNKDNEWFTKLEEMYEDCDFHPLNYTKSKYQSTFHSEFDKDYQKIEEIASGSIGQVYKITDKKGDVFAMKILHPRVNYQIHFFRFLFLIIKLLPPLHNILNYYFPFDLYSFIKDFKMQTNFINEVNHNLHFTNVYCNNPYIIIPQIYKFSNEIIIMSYEEGERFDKMDLSDYMTYKSIVLLKLFNKNNESIYNFMHGDLHKGNWKIRKENSDVKLIIYDFGFCWTIPELISKNLLKINQVFMDLQLEEKTEQLNKEKDIDTFSEIVEIFSSKKIPIKIIKEEVKKLIEREDVKYSDPIFFIKLILNSTRRGNITVDAHVLNCIIGHTQMDKLYDKITKDSFVDDKNKNAEYIYFKYFGDLINFCDTKNIFREYIESLKKELVTEKKRRNIKMNTLFDYNKSFDMNSKLKDMCIQDK